MKKEDLKERLRKEEKCGLTMKNGTIHRCSFNELYGFELLYF